MLENKDIIIVGGGPVGMVLALLLAKQNIGCTLLEARKQGAANQDTRALALSFGSRRILERLGVWQPLAVTSTSSSIRMPIFQKCSGTFSAGRR